MVEEECDRLEGIEYFKFLANWVNKFTGNSYGEQKRKLGYYNYPNGFNSFTQIEINLILVNR